MKKFLMLATLVATLGIGSIASVRADELKVEIFGHEVEDGFVEFYQDSGFAYEITEYQSGDECRGGSWDDFLAALSLDDAASRIQATIDPCGKRSAYICIDVDETGPFEPHYCGALDIGELIE